MTSRPLLAHLLDENAANVGVGHALADAEHHQVEGVPHLLGDGEAELTPPTSDLWMMSGDQIFSTTG